MGTLDPRPEGPRRVAPPWLHEPTHHPDVSPFAPFGSSGSEGVCGRSRAGLSITRRLGAALRCAAVRGVGSPAAAGADEAALLPALPRAGLFSEAAWCRLGARAGLGCPCEPWLPPASAGLCTPRPSRSARPEDGAAGGNGAAGAEPAALGGDPPAKLIGDSLKIQNASEGAPTPWQMPAGGEGHPGRALPGEDGSVPRTPSTLHLNLASPTAGGKLRHGRQGGSPCTQRATVPPPCPRARGGEWAAAPALPADRRRRGQRC